MKSPVLVRVTFPVVVALSIMVQSPVALLNRRLCGDEVPKEIVSAPAVELKRMVPPLASMSPSLSNEPPTENVPLGKMATASVSMTTLPTAVTLVSVKVRASAAPVPIE